MSDKKGEAPNINNNNNNNNNNENTENKIIEGKVEGGKIHRLKASACAVSAVTVYNDRAEISREVETFLSEEGTHTIVVYDLSPDVDQESIRIQGGEGNATILEVSHQEIFGDREELDQTTIMIRKMESIRLEKQKLNSKSANSQKERAWLDGFAQTIKNGPTNPSTSPLSSGNIKVEEFLSNSSAFLSYYSEQTSRLDDQDLEIALKLKELTGEENLLKKKVVQLQQDHLVDFRREVSVVVSAPSSTKIKMQLTYIIMNAHWTPSYDARMTSESEDLELSYFGSITNASGEDWNNVKLYLSTAAPSVGGAPPPLRFMKVEIDYGQRQQQVRNYDIKRKVDTSTQHVIDKITSNFNNQNLMLDDLLEQTEQLQTEAKQVWTTSRQKNTAHQKFTPHGTGSMTVMTAYAETSHVGASSATFEIPRRSTIVSDNKPHKVTITVIRLKAKLSHYATPDTSGHVYLKATAINTTEQYPFLTGPMNVFMNANFIAKSELPDVSPQEKFSVYLGTDSGVRLEVKPVRRVKEKQTGIINKTNIESFRHLSVVKNTRKSPINISVLCQVPASTDERIKVKLLHPDVKQESAVKFVDYKLLKWKLSIPAGQAKELHYHYNVEWPASINIVHMATK